MTGGKLDLTIVIITRNEEEMIEDCIRSAIASAETAVKNRVIKSYEIIHADSASTDRTVEIAGKYPVKILQLQAHWPLSAGAGLYIGYKFARGKYLMNLGGDMTVKKNWISKAVPYLKKEKGPGAISGFEDEFIQGGGYLFETMKETLDDTMPMGNVQQVGVAIFKMDVLRKIGGYNPYLKGAEDLDISYRIVSSNYKLLRIPETSVVHHWTKKSGRIDLIHMLKSAWTWSVGDGQGVRYALFAKSFVNKQISKYFRARQLLTYWYFMVMLAVAGSNLAALFLDMNYALAVLVADVIVIISIVAIVKKYSLKKKDVQNLVINIGSLWYRSAGFLVGYLRKPHGIETYPIDVKVIKSG